MSNELYEFDNEELDEHKIDYTNLDNEELDDSEIVVYELNKAILNLYKLCLEEMGYDLGAQFINNIDYVNYLEEENLNFSDEYEFNINNDMGANIGDLNLGLVPGEITDIGISDGMLNFISMMETSHKFGYTMKRKDLFGIDIGDAKGHRTFGYGLLINPITKGYMDSIKQSWSQEELESLYKYTVSVNSNKVDKWAQKNNISLNQNQKDAIVSAMFNFGPGFITNKGKVYSKTVNMIIQNPNNPEIKNAWSNMSNAQGKKYPGLIKRRKAEANWYFGIYV
jgi:GH24 family phage-related lysozyme (muramidase)